MPAGAGVGTGSLRRVAQLRNRCPDLEILEPDVMCPAVRQGALGVQIRAGDDAVGALISGLNHEPTAAAVTAERAVLAALGGGCQVPMGAHAWIEGGVLKLIAVVVSQDGERMVRASLEGAVVRAAALGADVAARLKGQGAAELLEEVYGPA